MLASKYLCSVLLFLCYAYRISYGKPDKFFRKSYKYLEATQSFYKIHTIHKTWQDAKMMCELEGATLFYPYDEEEADAVIGFWNQTQPFRWVYVGMSTPTVKEIFETVDGRSIEDVYNRWAPGEPNNAGGVEECVVLVQDGTLNDDRCDKKFPFICKKTEASLDWNEHCDIPDPSYEYFPKTGRCYKFHLTPKKWTDAYATCNIEQSRLAVINSQDEADILVQLTNKAPKDTVEGNYMRGAVHLGFKNLDGWKTVQNMSLKESGYTKWGNGQPDGQPREQCGSMFYNGHLNDISCDVRSFFICEHEIGVLRYAFDFRFGTGDQ